MFRILSGQTFSQIDSLAGTVCSVIWTMNSRNVLTILCCLCRNFQHDWRRRGRWGKLPMAACVPLVSFCANTHSSLVFMAASWVFLMRLNHASAGWVCTWFKQHLCDFLIQACLIIFKWLSDFFHCIRPELRRSWTFLNHHKSSPLSYWLHSDTWCLFTFLALTLEQVLSTVVQRCNPYFYFQLFVGSSWNHSMKEPQKHDQIWPIATHFHFRQRTFIVFFFTFL